MSGWFSRVFSKFFSNNTAKLNKLTESDVQNAIIEIEKRTFAVEEDVYKKAEEIEACKAKYKAATLQEMKMFHVKRAEMIQQEIKQKTQMLMFLMYNAKLLGRLKEAVVEKDFYGSASVGSLSNLMGDQRALASFLNETLQTRVKTEDMFTAADETFSTVLDAYEPDSRIYGMSSNAQGLAAAWALEESLEEEKNIVAAASGRGEKNASPEKSEDNNK